MEQWKDVIGYEGIYHVSDMGRVKSLPRKRKARNGLIQLRGRILKAAPNDRGYLTVVLCNNGKNKTFKVHQLVAMAFLNHKPCGLKLVVDHKNEIKTDNRLENLQILTNRKNLSKSVKNSSSTYTGATWVSERKKWKSCIHVDGRNIHLGFFDKEIEAANAYQKALLNYESSTSN